MMNRARYGSASTFTDYLEEVEKNQNLWRGLWERAELPAELARQARQNADPRYLLALSEDWCGDAVNILPWVARVAEAAPDVELRIVGRDDNPDLMDAHLTDGISRSIPVVIAYDEDFNELGWWGPRPAELQRWVKEEGSDLPPGERYARVRTWYARDRGQAIVQDILDLLATPVPVAP